MITNVGGGVFVRGSGCENICVSVSMVVSGEVGSSGGVII